MGNIITDSRSSQDSRNCIRSPTTTRANVSIRGEDAAQDPSAHQTASQSPFDAWAPGYLASGQSTSFLELGLQLKTVAQRSACSANAKGAVHSYGVLTVSPPDYVVYALPEFTTVARMSVGASQSSADDVTVHTTTPRSLCGMIISKAEDS